MLMISVKIVGRSIIDIDSKTQHPQK